MVGRDRVEEKAPKQGMRKVATGKLMGGRDHVYERWWDRNEEQKREVTVIRKEE